MIDIFNIEMLLLNCNILRIIWRLIMEEAKEHDNIKTEEELKNKVLEQIDVKLKEQSELSKQFNKCIFNEIKQELENLKGEQ